MNEVLRRFLGATPILAIAPLTGGLVNDSFDVRTPSGRYVLQAFNRAVFTTPSDVMTNFHHAREHLLATDYPLAVPQAIASPDGRRLIEDDDGRLWRLSVFIADTTSHERAPTLQHVQAAAMAYGTFLTYLRDLPIDSLTTTIPDFHHPASRYAAFEHAASAATSGRLDASAPAIAALVEAARSLDTDFSSLPVRVTHNDCKLANLLFHRERAEAVAVIDWDTLMPGHVVTDFGDMVRTLCTTADEESHPGEVQFDRAAFAALQAGFVASTRDWLTAAERERLFDGALYIVFEQALRFLTDHLAGDRYYGVRHARHNLVRAENQLSLLRDMRRAAPTGDRHARHP